MSGEADTISSDRSGVRLRSIALPTEHGGWGFAIEPIVLGMLVAPTISGLLLSIAAMAAFLLRQPLKIVMVDRRRGLRTSRTRVAQRFLMGYFATSIGALTAALLIGDPTLLLPLVLALPFGAIFLFYDLGKPGRTLAAEVAAPLAMASVAAAIPLASGWMLLPSLALWVALGARALPSILFVRSRLRLDRGRPTTILMPIAAHLLALFIVAVLVGWALLPFSAVWAFLLLLLRAIVLLSPRRPMVSVKVIGFTELGLGILVTLMLAIPY